MLEPVRFVCHDYYGSYTPSKGIHSNSKHKKSKMGKLLVFLALVAAVAIQEVSRNVINWLARNPTMWTEQVGYLVPFLLVAFAFLAPKIINQFKFPKQ